MKQYEISVEFHVSGLSQEALMAQFEAFCEALADLDELNPQMDSWAAGFDAGIGALDVQIYIENEYETAATADAYYLIRTAIHAAGGSTPTWGERNGTQAFYEDASNPIPVFA